jgi:WD40 repeat protein
MTSELSSKEAKGLVIATGLCALLAGCNGPARIAGSAVYGSISASENAIAYYTKDWANLPTQPVTGAFLRAGGNTIDLGPAVSGIAFARDGETMTFASADQAVDSHVEHLGIWTPELDRPIVLSTGNAKLATMAPDGSLVAYLDLVGDSSSSKGNLMLFEVGDCTSTACAPIQIAADVSVQTVAMSRDGRYIGYTVTAADAANGHSETWLFNVSQATTTQVATTRASSFVSFSPDGSLLLTTTDLDGKPRQLAVLSTDTGSNVAWTPLPDSAQAIAGELIDDQTAIVLATSTAGPSVFRVTAQGAVVIAQPATKMIVGRDATDAARWLFVVNGGAAPSVNAYDLSSSAPSPISLSSASDGTVQLSQDGTVAALLEGFDPQTSTGSLVLVGVADGSRTVLAPHINSEAFVFAERGPSLLWLDGGHTLNISDGSGTMPIATNVFNFRPRRHDVYYSTYDSLADASQAAAWVERLP